MKQRKEMGFTVKFGLQQTLIFMQNCQNEIGTDVRNEKVQKKQKEGGCAKERKKENEVRINF